MTENISEIGERIPRSPEVILAAVGLSPENIREKSVLFLGNGEDQLAGNVEGATITDADIDHFLYYDEIPPEGTEVDYVLAVDSDHLAGDLHNPDRMDLLAATVRALNPTGEIRIGQPMIAEGGNVSADEIGTMFEYALYDRALDVRTSYIPRNNEHGGYLIIIPRT